MDVELLSKMIGELVLESDTVGVPGLGTFVAKFEPAAFTDRGYTIAPPYRRLEFRTEVLEEDVLAVMYSDSNSVPVERGKEILREFAETLKRELSEKHTVVFPGLGRLRSTSNGQIFFVGDESLDVFPDGFGLQAVSLKSHTDEEVLSWVRKSAQEALSDMGQSQDGAPEPAREDEPGDEVASPDDSYRNYGHFAGYLEPEDVHEKGHLHIRWSLLLMILLAVAIVLFSTFIVLTVVAPDFVDKLLYTEEELRIINY